MRNRARFVPSLFTILNLFCGFLSIINAANNNPDQACLFIIYAALFDAFDGVVARFTGTSSKFGVELDSLADVISFGAAPSYLMYNLYFYRLNGPGIAIAALIMIFSALRLARFNTQLVGLDKNFFSGLPVPIAAVTVASFFLYYFNKNFSADTSRIFVYVLCLTLPVLMVSKFKYDTTPKFSAKDFKAHPVKSILTILILVMLFLTRGESLFPFCLFYMSTGIFRTVKNLFKKIFLSKHSPEQTFSAKII